MTLAIIFIWFVILWTTDWFIKTWKLQIELERIKNDIPYYELYNNWVDSWYIKDLRPSIDRIDNYKWYSYDNIQLMTWKENNEKRLSDLRECKLIHWNKPQKAVKWINKITWEVVEYKSIHQAERLKWINNANIVECCKWKRKSAWGYIWSYI